MTLRCTFALMFLRSYSGP